jgi:glycosyltransferase involved in cell wall biosynthesis
MHVALNAQLVSFGDSYRNAGVSRYTYRLVDGLARYGGEQEYSAFVTARDGSSAQALASERVRLVPARWPTERPAQRVLWEQVALPGLLRRLAVDVFHSPVNVLPGRLPCPSVVTIHDLAFLHYPQFFRPARRMYQRTFTTRSARAATLVVTVSESTKRDVVELGVDPARVRVIYPSIDERFRPVEDPERLRAFRAAQGLPERYCLYLGTLEPRKNVVGLLEAYARLRSLDADAPPLVLAGAKGWYYDAVFERVRALGLERAVTFAGYVRDEEQPLWYAAAEIFMYPSFFEGFGLPVAEAMASGTPVITSNVSSLPEAAGDAAILVDPSSPEPMAHAMHRVLRDREARLRLVALGLRRAHQFSLKHMIEAYSEAYADAARLAGHRYVAEVG